MDKNLVDDVREAYWRLIDPKGHERTKKLIHQINQILEIEFNQGKHHVNHRKKL